MRRSMPMSPFSTFFAKDGPLPACSVPRSPVLPSILRVRTGSTFWYGNFDEPNCKFRTWQIPCSSTTTAIIWWITTTWVTVQKVCTGWAATWIGKGIRRGPEHTLSFHFPCCLRCALSLLGAGWNPRSLRTKNHNRDDLWSYRSTGVQVANRTDSPLETRWAASVIPRQTAPLPYVRATRQEGRRYSADVWYRVPLLFRKAEGNLWGYRALPDFGGKERRQRCCPRLILADDREALIEASVETAKQRGLSCEI